MTEKRGGVPTLDPQVYQALVTKAHKTVIRQHTLNWEFGGIMTDLLGPPPPPGSRDYKGVTAVVEQFRVDVLKLHTDSNGDEGLGAESIPSAKNLLDFRRMVAAFPPKQRSGLSMPAAQLLAKKVPDPAERKRIIKSIRKAGTLPNEATVRKVLTREGVISEPVPTPTFMLLTRGIQRSATLIGSIKLHADDLSMSQCREVGKQLRALDGLISNVILTIEGDSGDQVVKKRRAA